MSEKRKNKTTLVPALDHANGVLNLPNSICGDLLFCKKASYFKKP